MAATPRATTMQSPRSPSSIAARLTDESLTASRFAIVGAVATVIHMTIVWVLASVYGMQVFVANLVAFGCAFAFSFAGHHWWTFRTTGSVRRRLVRFFLISVAGLAASSVLLSMVLSTGLLTPANSALVAVAIVPVLSFVFSRLWGFNGR